MMVTLTKLLVIRIVASVRSESSRNIDMLLSAGFFSVSRLSRSCGDKLKNAISEPLAKPDNKSKKAARRAANRTPVVTGWNTTRSLMCCMSVKSNLYYCLLFVFLLQYEHSQNGNFSLLSASCCCCCCCRCCDSCDV